jgi:hypothetical protein
MPIPSAAASWRLYDNSSQPQYKPDAGNSELFHGESFPPAAIENRNPKIIGVESFGIEVAQAVATNSLVDRLDRTACRSVRGQAGYGSNASACS